MLLIPSDTYGLKGTNGALVYIPLALYPYRRLSCTSNISVVELFISNNPQLNEFKTIYQALQLMHHVIDKPFAVTIDSTGSLSIYDRVKRFEDTYYKLNWEFSKYIGHVYTCMEPQVIAQISATRVF